jgi:hypothetical protein
MSWFSATRNPTPEAVRNARNRCDAGVPDIRDVQAGLSPQPCGFAPPITSPAGSSRAEAGSPRAVAALA